MKEYIMRNLSITSIAIFILACLASNISASDLSESQRHKENSLKILAIGDSNGALPDGWVTQLKKIRTIVSPPPFGPDQLVGEKYAGGLDRVRQLNEMLVSMAKVEKIYFIDSFHILLPVFNSLSADGVHLNPDGQMMIARIIQENLKYSFVGR